MKKENLIIYGILGLLLIALLSFNFLDLGSGKSDSNSDYVSVLGEDTFPIGIYYQPAPEHTTFEKYEELKKMNVNFIVGTNGITNPETTDAALKQIEANGLKLLIDDTRFRELPNDDVMDTLGERYKNHPAVLGYHIYDEPSTKEMVKLASMTDRLKSKDPNSLVFVNLFPNYASSSQLFQKGTMPRSELRPDQSIGQTFRTKKNESLISTIQLGMFAEDWEVNEKLQLTLWDSPKKSKLIAEQSLTGTGEGSDWMLFTLDAKVKPNTTYYIELTHQGGGDNIVSRVYHSKLGEKWFTEGSAYINDKPIDADLWFTINQSFEGNSYEEYVYRWMRTNPEVLVFDNYPFREDVNAEISYGYYKNLEIIRRQSLAGSVHFWTYIQSVGLEGMLRSPSQNELRFHIYSNLVYGAKGYMYFTYETPIGSGFHEGIILPEGNQSPLYEWAKQLNSEAMNLGPTLLKITSQEVYHTGELPVSTVELPRDFFWQPVEQDAQLIIGYSLDKKGRKYVMVVNRDWRNSTTVQFRIAGSPASINEISKSTGEETMTNFDPATGTLSADFAAGEGRLFLLPKGF